MIMLLVGAPLLQVLDPATRAAVRGEDPGGEDPG
jgi:hypothetical protein